MLTKNKTFIIAEAGVNHNGKLSNALKLVNLAKNCGADAIKFQTWDTNEIIVPNTNRPKYQLKNSKELDQYNFDNPQGSNFAEKMLMLGKNVIDNPSPYGIMRAISGQFGSGSGEGAPIKINLGPASDFYDEDQLAGIMSTQAAKDVT